MDVSTIQLYFAGQCRFFNTLPRRSDSTDGLQWSDKFWKLACLRTELHMVKQGVVTLKKIHLFVLDRFLQ